MNQDICIETHTHVISVYRFQLEQKLGRLTAATGHHTAPEATILLTHSLSLTVAS